MLLWDLRRCLLVHAMRVCPPMRRPPLPCHASMTSSPPFHSSVRRRRLPHHIDWQVVSKNAGQVGFVSPRAEFTPKTVQTEALRTELVYRLRIRVPDADDQLLQGMPVTIRLGRP